MSKKTLNEATVRQFMKLVNHKPATISNFISENYTEEAELEESAEATVNEDEEVVAEAEDEDADPVGDPELDAEPVGDEPPMDMEPELDAAPEEELGGSEVDITPEMASAIVELGDMLRPLVAGEEEAPVDELPPEEPPMDLEPAEEEPPLDDEEEPAMMENDEQMVQEVARRVAKRILKAREAKKALGNK